MVPVSWWQIGAAPFFNTLDQDASGGLSLEECASALLAAGDYLSADRTLSRFQHMDTDADGAISFSEFATARALPGASFESIDQDQSLFLNASEIADALRGVGDFVDDDQASARFHSLDTDENGEVSKAEFSAAPGLAMHSRHLQYRPSAFQRMAGGVLLQLHSSHYLQPGEDTVLRFQMQNPPLSSVVLPVRISSVCAACTCSDGRCSSASTQEFVEQTMKMDCVDANLECNSDAAFQISDPAISFSGSIRESTSVLGARNILTIEFHTSGVLPSGSGLLIRGLPWGYLLPAGAKPPASSSASVCLQGRSSVEFECRECTSGASGSAAGHWRMLDAEGRLGELYIRVNNGTKLPAGHHVVAFPFYNPVRTFRAACKANADGVNIVDRDCPSTVQLTLHVSAQYDELGSSRGVVLEDGELGVLGGGDVASWLQAEVMESNSFAGFDSHIVIQLEASVDFPILTSFTLSGLPSRHGMRLFDRNQPAVIALTGIEVSGGRVSDCFDPSLVTLSPEGTEISWQMKPSSSTTSCFVAARTIISFAIPVVNFNVSASDDVQLRIRAQHPGCRGCVPDACKCSSAPRDPAHPFDLPWRQILGRKLTAKDGTISYIPVLRSDASIVLANAQISESHSVSGERATIIVSFRPSAAMLTGSNLTVSGLRPSATASSDRIPISSAHQRLTHGRFDAAQGTLIWSLEEDSTADEVLDFSFQLQHTDTGATQEFHLCARIITPVCLAAENPHCSLLVAAGLPRLRVREVLALLEGGALGVSEQRALVVHRISGVTAVGGALDISTVDLQANFRMLAGYSITISGLAGSNILDESVDGLTAVKTRIGGLPTCECYGNA